MNIRWLHTLPLKTLIPLTFLTSGFLLIILFYLFVLPIVTKSISESNQRQAEALTQIQQGQLITLLAQDDMVEVKRVLFFASSDPTIKRMMIADEMGTIRYASRSILVGGSLQNQLSNYINNAGNPPLKTGEITISTQEDAPNIIITYASLPFEYNGEFREWSLVSVMDYNQIVATTEDLVIFPSNILALFFVISGLLTAFVLREKLNRRLIPLVASARKVADGEKGIQTNLSGLDEFAELSHAFDDMLAQIEHQQEKLEETIDSARASNEAKTIFLSNLSHQVRTPLANVIGFLELLQEETPNADNALYIRSALASANTLLGLIEDILEFSRFERGEALVINESFCLNLLTQEIVESFLPITQERNLDMTITSDNPEPIWIASDFRLIRQILINLINNAIQYTEAGNIKIDISASETSEIDKTLISLSVTDTGAGIDAETVKNLSSQLSAREKAPITSKVDSGIGLALCWHFGRMLDGSWEIDSKPGHGSTFTFHMLAEQSEPENDTISSQEMLKAHLNIMIVEDNTINQMLMRNMLEKWGHTVELTTDGEQAIERIKETLIYPDRASPDLILMDLELPGRSGIETTTAIRELSEQTKSIPIIAVTANVSQEYRSQCLQVGMNGFVEKPINSHALTTEIFRAVR